MTGLFHSTGEVPVLQTERLRLRGHHLDDFVQSAMMWADPEVTRYIGGKPFTEEESWARFLRSAGHWSMLGFGYWLAEERSTGNYVGEVGFGEFKRDLTPSLRGVPEIGWALASHVHGMGYATEAVRVIVAWGDAHFRSAPTACIIDPENLASVRVAEKCGYRKFRLTAYRGQPTMIFVREPRVS